MKMNMYYVCGVVKVACSVVLYGCIAVGAFLISKYLGFALVGAFALGTIAEELQFRERRKHEEKMAGEFMQMLAAKSGQGSC